MPATCVPWKDAFGSSAIRPSFPAPGPGNERATITFGVVHFRPPFGNPAGYEKPAGSKKALAMSTPSSTTPIFTPSPRAPAPFQSASAWISSGPRFIVST